MDTVTKRKPAHGVLPSRYSSLSASVHRLSRGLRSTQTPRRDMLDCSIRALMRSDISALQQGVKNANDAISLLQTALTALDTIEVHVQKMQEIAEDASSSSPSRARSALELDYQEHAGNITTIATTTEFEGIHPLDGSLAGSGAERYGFVLPADTQHAFGARTPAVQAPLEIAEATAQALGLGRTSVATQTLAKKAVMALREARAQKEDICTDLRKRQKVLEQTIATLTVHSQNLQSIETRISDVDVANEMMLFVKQQILTNSAVAMLSQASPLSEIAMTLVR